jgi:MFS family permease
VAFLMSLCNRRFSATQFALLSAFASVGRVWVGPLAGVLAQSIGWPAFFIASTIVALPALALLLALARDRYAGGRPGSQRATMAGHDSIHRRTFSAVTLAAASAGARSSPCLGARGAPPPAGCARPARAKAHRGRAAVAVVQAGQRAAGGRQAAAKQYNDMLGQAAQKPGARRPPGHPQVERPALHFTSA